MSKHEDRELRIVEVMGVTSAAGRRRPGLAAPLRSRSAEGGPDLSKSTAISVLAAAVLATGVGSACAADQDVSATVQYGDLDLSTHEGAEVMLQRIALAARRVCAPDADIANLPGLGDWLKYCVSSRVSLTVSRLGAPMVTAAYKSRTSKSLCDPRIH